jgi:glycosyltransferase involved in cell wall biosynthesis
MKYSATMPAPHAIDLSIVVPMYNESEVIGLFFERILAVLEPLDLSFEIVCVNDGSKDDTLEQLRALAAEDHRIVVVDLSRNFGKEPALTAGLDQTCGRAVVPIDADLQDPPELIAQFVEKWREGYHVVYGVRASRKQDSFLKRVTAGGFYWTFNQITSVPIPSNSGDFRLLDRRAIDALSLLPERNRFMKGLFAWVGFKSIGIPFERPERAAGTTKFGGWKLWNFAIDGITGFSTVPLRVWSYFGLLVSLIAFGYASFIVVRTLIMGIDVPGYASLLTIMLFLGGIQLISLGVMGEYLGRMYQEIKARPVYLVQEVIRRGDADPRD